MAYLKDKSQIGSVLLIVLLVASIAVLVGIYSFYTSKKNISLKTPENEALAAKPTPWYTYLVTCTLNSSSTDRTPPVVTITSHKDGDKIILIKGQANIKIDAVASDDQLLYQPLLENSQTKAWLLVNGDVRDFSSNHGTIYNDTPFSFWWGVTTSVTPGKTYEFKVGMCDAAGNLSYSPVVKVISTK